MKRLSSPAVFKSENVLPESNMKDVQSSADTRGIAIDQVGITNLRYPISVKTRGGRPMATVADISMSVHFRITSRALT
jgi:GTP cyclohydrolase I